MSKPLHLFIIHSGITGLVAKLVARRLQLATEQIRVAYTNDTTYKIGLELTEGKEEYLINWQEVARKYTDKYIECNFTAEQYYEDALRIRKELYQFLEQQEYICYVPCSDNAGFFLPFNFANCVGLGFLEEGTLQYLGSTYYASDYEKIIQPFLAEHPEYEYERSGIPPASRQHPLDVDNIIYNPKLGTEASPIIFYRLTSYAFNYRERTGSESKKLEFVTFSVEEVFNIPYTSKILPYYAKLLKDNHVPFPDFFAKQIRIPVWILDTVYPNYCDKAKFQALYNHIASSLQYGLYKHIFIKPHPNHVINGVIIEFLDRLCKGYELEYTLLGSDCVIEQELALFPNNTLEIHGVTSSALLYARFFNQNVCSYVELLQRDEPWNKFISAIYFNPQNILAEVTKRHQQEIDKDPEAFKQHEKQLHLRKLQNLEGQLLALDYCYLQALYQHPDLKLIKEIRPEQTNALTAENIKLLLSGDTTQPTYQEVFKSVKEQLTGIRNQRNRLVSDISNNLRTILSLSEEEQAEFLAYKPLDLPEEFRSQDSNNDLTSTQDTASLAEQKSAASANYSRPSLVSLPQAVAFIPGVAVSNPVANSGTTELSGANSAEDKDSSYPYQEFTVSIAKDKSIKLHFNPEGVNLGLPSELRFNTLKVLEVTKDLLTKFSKAELEQADLEVLVLRYFQARELAEGWITIPEDNRLHYTEEMIKHGVEKADALKKSAESEKSGQEEQNEAASEKPAPSTVTESVDSEAVTTPTNTARIVEESLAEPDSTPSITEESSASELLEADLDDPFTHLKTEFAPNSQFTFLPDASAHLKDCYKRFGTGKFTPILLQDNREVFKKVSELEMLSMLTYHVFIIRDSLGANLALQLAVNMGLTSHDILVLTSNPSLITDNPGLKSLKYININDFEAEYRILENNFNMVKFLEFAQKLNLRIDNILNFNRFVLYAPQLDSLLTLGVLFNPKLHDFNIVEQYGVIENYQDLGITKVRELYEQISEKFPMLVSATHFLKRPYYISNIYHATSIPEFSKLPITGTRYYIEYD